MTRLTRRRFLTISAALCLAPGAKAGAGLPEARWRGTALGAAASVRIVGLSQDQGHGLLAEVEAELRRLEGIFSLHRPASAISRLNTTGRLDGPPPELLEVLSLSEALHRATEGAFDPTVQPVFAAHADALASGTPLPRAALQSARERVGWEAVRFDAGAVRFDRPGTAITLNGVAQGYITDRVAGLLRSRGLGDTLIDAGEIAASGRRADGAPWNAGIAGLDGSVLKRLTLSDRALATSAPLGTILDPDGRVGHIFDPATGDGAAGPGLVSVSAPSAAVADGLSTALCVLPPDRWAAALAGFGGAAVEVAL